MGRTSVLSSELPGAEFDFLLEAVLRDWLKLHGLQGNVGMRSETR